MQSTELLQALGDLEVSGEAAELVYKELLLRDGEIEGLRVRQSELHALIVKISQTVPFESEVVVALDQRGKLIAEIGTLRAALAEAKPAAAALDRMRTQLLAIAFTDDDLRLLMDDIHAASSEYNETNEEVAMLKRLHASLTIRFAHSET